jgi:hypothetical protein
VHLLVAVKGAEEEASILTALKAADVLSAQAPEEMEGDCSTGTKIVPVFSRPASLPAHKVLFHTTEVGKMAIVRQLKPALHIDTEAATLHSLAPHVKGKLLELRLEARDEASSKPAAAPAKGHWPVMPRASLFQVKLDTP